jgi:hypothetical protein
MSRTLLSLAGFQVIISGRFWAIAEGQEGQVEIAEWARPSAGRYRGAFEQVLKIAIIVVAQASHADALPVAQQLASDIAVLAAVMSFDCESAVGP